MNKLIDLISQMPVGGYPAHPAADAFPMMEGKTYEEFEADVKRHGLRQEIILIADSNGRMVLEGRNRQKAALATKTPLRYRMFDPRKDGESPAALVASMNYHRRDLTFDQRAAAGAELVTIFAAEAEKRRLGNLKKGAESPTASNEAIGKNGGKPEAEMGRSTAVAAAAVGVSRSTIDRAVRRMKVNPEAHAAAKAGKKAAPKIEAGAPGTPEYDKALERIEAVCGKQLAQAVKEKATLRKPKDLLLYVRQTDEKMLALRHFIFQNRNLEWAIRYKSEHIMPTHRVEDLGNRAMIAGGRFLTTVELGNGGFVKLDVECVTKDGRPIKFR